MCCHPKLFLADYEGTSGKLELLVSLDGQCVASTESGEMLLRMPESKAMTLTETLSAIFFIMNAIKGAGYTLSTMGEAAKHFIANWESEKYRKSLAGKK